MMTIEDFIFDIYATCWKARHAGVVGHTYCSRLMTPVTRGHDWSWRVSGITEEALKIYRDDGWRHLAGNGIQRAHVVDRADMVRHVFERDDPMTKEELLSYWIETDRTILATKKQNSAGLPQEFIIINRCRENGLFTDKGTGFNFRISKEGQLLKTLYNQAINGSAVHAPLAKL
jgi:hypothetical protein